ncbi:MAG: OadG family protein [Planctomycetota bacterium]
MTTFLITSLVSLAPVATVSGAGALGDAPAMGTGVALMIVGMSVVFSSLVVIGLVIGLISMLAQPNAVDEAPVQPAGRPSPEDAVSPELVAVITAAATAAVRRPVRVRRVVMLGRSDGDPWVSAGRAVLIGSHRLHTPGRN